MPLSIRFAIIRSSSAGSPLVHLLRARVQVRDAVARERSHVDRLLAPALRLAARQHQQALDQPLAAVDRLPDRLAHRPQLFPTGVAVGERHVNLCAHDRERGAQLMRRVGDEVTLARERGVKPAEHPVECVRQLLQLVCRPRERDPLSEVLPGHAAGRGGDLAQWPQRPSGKPPARADSDHRHHAEREQVLDHQPVQRVAGYLCLHIMRDVRRRRVGSEAERSSGGRGVAELAEQVLAEVVMRRDIAADEQVPNRQQHRPRDEEDEAVQHRKPQPDRRGGSVDPQPLQAPRGHHAIR
jgi:hypothetical protein